MPVTPKLRAGLLAGAASRMFMTGMILEQNSTCTIRNENGLGAMVPRNLPFTIRQLGTLLLVFPCSAATSSSGYIVVELDDRYAAASRGAARWSRWI